MLKKSFFALTLLLICSTIFFAQNVNRQNEAQYEYLVVSMKRSGNNLNGEFYRDYTYLNSDLTLIGEASLDWLGKAGWELVGATDGEGYSSLLFKRIYNSVKTEKEINTLREWQKTQSGKSKSNTSNLVDLDQIESERNLENFNRSEKEKLKRALEQIKDFPVEIVSIESKSKIIGRTSASAELMIDATSVLLKTGNNYRSSEVETYFQEILKKLADTNQFINVPKTMETRAKAISGNLYTPQEIGFLSPQYSGIMIKISIIVNYNNQPNIVGQAFIYNINWNNKTE